MLIRNLAILFSAAAVAFLTGAARAEDNPHTEVNVLIEQSFTASKSYTDPFNDVTLDVTFTDPAGKEMKVPAFWAGANVWKVRYASPVVGKHTYRTESSDASDKGLHGVTGSVEIKAYTGDNPLYVHGPIRVASDQRHVEYADGTPFFWLGDTWWMGLSHRLHWPEDVKTLAADRKAKGFNVIQIVAGLYPDMFPFDPRGANEAGFPWEKDYTHIRPEYFDAADKRLFYLVDQGFSPCIVGAWGYFMPWMGVEKMKQHWRNLIARYGALPVVWCAAGEANLPWYLAKGFPYDDRKQVTDWTEVMRYIRATDPYHRMLTVHPTGLGRWSARHCTDDPSLLDFDMLQTPHGQRDAVALTVNTFRESYKDTPRMPVLDGEAAYEMLMDTIPAKWSRRMFWLCMMNGAAGHTYGANGIWQVNRKGQPHGPSPHHAPGVGYGAIAWDDAMNLPGSTHVSLGKKFFEQFEWTKFQPHPEWARYLDAASLDFEGSDWIWFDEGKPAADAPAEKRYFRRIVEIPADAKIKSAMLRVSVDDQFSASVNGTALGTSATDEGWRVGRQFDVTKALKPGRNIIAVEAENRPAPSANPAGLLARLEVQLDNGQTQAIASNADWRVSKEPAAGWEAVDFDDSAWSKPVVVAHYGEAPWGKLTSLKGDPIFGPQALGIPGQLRVVYVPDAEPVELRDLAKGAAYDASWFDPTTGETKAFPKVEASDAGIATVSPPAATDHDWVLVLREPK